MTPKPAMFHHYYQNGGGFLAFKDSIRQPEVRFGELFNMRVDFNLDSDTPHYVLKDILLENGFTEYCELLFPESRNE